MTEADSEMMLAASPFLVYLSTNIKNITHEEASLIYDLACIGPAFKRAAEFGRTNQPNISSLKWMVTLRPGVVWLFHHDGHRIHGSHQGRQ